MTENNQASIAEAATLKELNIHIGYIREKINTNQDMTVKSFGELKEQITLQAHNFVNQDEFKSVKDICIENNNVIKGLVEFKDTLTGKMWGISVMAGGIVGLITMGVNYFLK